MMERNENKFRKIAYKWRAEAKAYKERLEQMEANFNEMKQLTEDWSKAYDDILAVLIRFNKLPWYKKMFYKFNV